MSTDWLSSALVFGLFEVVMFIGMGFLLHMQLGLAGIGNFGVVGFWGLGMYAYGIIYGGHAPSGTDLVVNIPWPFGDPWQAIVSVILATIVAGLGGLLIGWIISGMDLDGQLVGTFGFAAIVFLLARSQKGLTGSEGGIGGLDFPYDIGSEKANAMLWLLVVSAIVIAIGYYTWRVHRSPYGRLLIATGQNEPLARSLGKPSNLTKLWMFTVTSAGMGLLGAMFAVIVHFLTPLKLGVDVTLAVIVALILGGAARVWGPVIGVLLTVGLFEIVIQLYAPFPDSWYRQAMPVVKQIIYGVSLIVVLMYRPLGILGDMRRDKLMRSIHGD